MQALGEEMQIPVAKAKRLELFYGREHVIAVGARAAVALADIMQLGSKIELAGILRVRAVDHEAKRLHPAPRLAVEQHGPHGLAVDGRDLLALAQIRNRGVAMLCRGPVG